jgi:hypothetical protein
MTGGHAVQIEPGLQRQPPKNGNISILKAFGRRPRCKPHRCDRPASETLNTPGLTRRSKLVVLFDDFVGLREQRWRQRKVEYLRGFQVNDQLECNRLLDGQIGGS